MKMPDDKIPALRPLKKLILECALFEKHWLPAKMEYFYLASARPLEQMVERGRVRAELKCGPGTKLHASNSEPAKKVRRTNFSNCFAASSERFAWSPRRVN
jgi:hypothetical protein